MIKIDSGIPLQKRKMAGRKPGTKDSRKFANRGRPPKSDAVHCAADAVRAGESGIVEAAYRFFDEHCGINKSYSEEANQKRFVRFINAITENLKSNPKGRGFAVYRELGKVRAQYMRSPRYKENQRKIINTKIKNELKAIEANE